MSFPNIPNVTPVITITRDDSINLLLASIAFEELGLSHLINSEAEKIQYVLGTLEEQSPLEPATIGDLLEINRSVEQTLKSVVYGQMLHLFQLEDIANYRRLGIHVNTATVTADYNGQTYSDRANAYYHTGRGGF